MYILEVGEMLIGGVGGGALKKCLKSVITCSFAMVFGWKCLFWWGDKKCEKVKIKRSGGGFMRLGDFGGGCVVGVCLDLLFKNANMRS